MSWEYEGIFERIDPETSPLIYDWWKTLPPEVAVGQMGYRRRTTVAGPRLEAEIFPIFGRAEEKAARAAKQNLSRDAQKRLNDRRSQRKLIQLVDANFGEDDCHVTLSYAGMEPGIPQVKKDMRNFLARVKRAWKKKERQAKKEGRRWPELKYIYAIGGDEMPSAGYSGKRPHVHMLLTGGMTEKELIAIWEKGLVKSSYLQPNNEGLEGLCKYFTKQRFDRPPKKNARMWCGSRNLKQPKTRTTDVKKPNTRIMHMSYSYQSEAKEIMERIYPSYQFVKCSVYFSEVVRGVYIRAVMRKRT